MATKIKIRDMVPEDAGAVAEVEKLCFAVPWSRESFWRDVSNDCTVYLLAEDTQKTPPAAVGYIGAWILAGEAEITNVAVAPAYRGQKIGTKLLSEFIARLKKLRVTAMTLEVRPSNSIALSLYQKFGFTEAGRRKGYYADNGEDAIIMWNTKL